MDIKLNAAWELTKSKTGDAPLVEGLEELLQEIRLEALTQTGELFYDPDFGWSLLDFMHRDADDLDILEIKARVQQRLSKRSEVDGSRIAVDVKMDGDNLMVYCRFRLVTGQELALSVSLSGVEVSEND